MCWSILFYRYPFSFGGSSSRNVFVCISLYKHVSPVHSRKLNILDGIKYARKPERHLQFAKRLWTVINKAGFSFINQHFQSNLEKCHSAYTGS